VINALRALRRREVLRWLTLLECADLMMDVLLGFLALYFVDVVGATPAQAGGAVAVWTARFPSGASTRMVVCYWFLRKPVRSGF
jgi:hypothetical protein